MEYIFKGDDQKTLPSTPSLLRSGGLKVRLAQVDCIGEFKGKGSGGVFGNNQR